MQKVIDFPQKKKKLRLLSLFSGIGAFEKALERMGREYELVNYCEIDKYAGKAYSLIHGVKEELNLGDITRVDETKLQDIDLMTYGFPCQDISIAGQQKGIIEGETRSGLLYDALRILKHARPKYAIAENVKNLVNKNFRSDFYKLLDDLESFGYKNYWAVLNAKDFGIPQSRERVFVVSIRKDIDDGSFRFPEGFRNGILLEDVMEDEVDEKYFICSETAEKMIHEPYSGIYDIVEEEQEITDGTFPCLMADRLKKRKDSAKRFRKPHEPMFTLTTKDRHGILLAGRLDIKGFDQRKRVYLKKGISPTLTVKDCKVLDDYRIRKLTPLECFRLMGFDDIDFYRAKYGLNRAFYKGKDRSDSQLYKMAGNSIVVDVLIWLLRNLLSEDNQEIDKTRLITVQDLLGIKDSTETINYLIGEKYALMKRKYPKVFMKKAA